MIMSVTWITELQLVLQRLELIYQAAFLSFISTDESMMKKTVSCSHRY